MNLFSQTQQQQKPAKKQDMGVKILIHVRHIRGHTFDVEVDRDADCLGLKVAIWDSQKITVEGQRLVYAGKEVVDESNLMNLGIGDGSTIFLVERVANESPVPVSVMDAQVAQVELVPEESVSQVEPMSVNSQYQELPNDATSQERVQSTIDLAFWVRIYCIFGTVVSLVAMLGCCWFSIIPLICYVFGYFGCRKLNRCCLVFPMLVAILAGPVGFVFVIWNLFAHFRPEMFVPLFVSFLHILIMASICKLRCRIKHLNTEEKRLAVEKIRAGIKCWCC